MFCGGVCLLAEVNCFLLKLFGGWTVLWKAFLGFVEKQEAVVPCAEGILSTLEAGGQACNSLRIVGAGLGDVAGGFSGFPYGVELVILLGVEMADGRGKPFAREANEFGAAEIEIEDWFQNGLEFVEFLVKLLLVFAQLDSKLVRRLSSGGDQLAIELVCVVIFLISLEKIAMDIEVSNCAGSTANLAQGFTKRF